MDKPASRNGDATAAWFDWSIKNAASTKYDTFLAAYALGRAAVSERRDSERLDYLAKTLHIDATGDQREEKVKRVNEWVDGADLAALPAPKKNKRGA